MMPLPESETTKQTEPRRKTEVLINRLGELRDGLLLLAGFVYLLGYTSWANYALDTRIGLLPVLDAQYFAAGIVPALIILLFILSVRVLRAFQRWLKRPISDKHKTVQKTLIYIAMALFVVFGILTLIFRKNSPEWLSWLPFVFCGFIILAAFFSRAKGDLFLQRTGLFLIWSYTILGALWLILGYNLQLFPHLPSELGGPKPRCACLDLDGSQISPETRLQLRGNLATSTEHVFRSVPVYLIFDGSEYVLLAERSDPLSRANRVYRLRKESVKGVFPCESEGALP
jgi:hypothetical protein